jgi:hypothetical protein
VIEDLLFNQSINGTLNLLVYFYFDLNDQSKRSGDNLLRSLILQLSRQSQAAFDILQELHNSTGAGWSSFDQCTSSQPSTEQLLQTLFSMIRRLGRIYIVLDGVDESSDREATLAHISEIISCVPSNASLFVTSRDERDICISFEKLNPTCLPIHGAEVENDIRLFIDQSLHNEPALSKWSENLRADIRSTLINGARGM